MVAQHVADGKAAEGGGQGIGLPLVDGGAGNGGAGPVEVDVDPACGGLGRKVEGGGAVGLGDTLDQVIDQHHQTEAVAMEAAGNADRGDGDAPMHRNPVAHQFDQGLRAQVAHRPAAGESGAILLGDLFEVAGENVALGAHGVLESAQLPGLEVGTAVEGLHHRAQIGQRRAQIFGGGAQ